MNCCWLCILLLLCNGNFGTNTTNNGGCNSSGSGCGGNGPGNGRRNGDMPPVGGPGPRSMPSAWESDCGCNGTGNTVQSTPARQDFPGIGRSDTCGCENNGRQQ
jgi:hypothetical protein